jgi:hypothetical protein
MKSSLIKFGLALFGLPVALQVNVQSALDEHLKPMEATIGNWEAKVTGPNGQEQIWKSEVKADLGGATLRVDWCIENTQAQVVYSQHIVYYWDPRLRALAASGFSSTGDCYADVMVKKADDKTVWQSSGVEKEGKLITSLTEFSMPDSDTLVAQVSHTIVAGEPVADGQKITFKRVKNSVSKWEVMPANGNVPVFAVRMATLKPGITAEALEKFVKEELNPACKGDFGGQRFLIMKADRGENKGRYVLLWGFDSTEIRAKYYPVEGATPPAEAQKAEADVLKPVNDVLNKLDTFITIASEYTDFLPVR